ncbi:hypothetical protein SK128_018668 [Halocaridina rubra]|uniref:Major facilitator superfamily associated domain-containing protein n=1 Tax=Halocaridina rubra TaxID=373956 RepID=A0AAN9AHD5_HALRR
MAIKINKKLLPLKVHYFLKYGGMSFFPFLPALIRQKGVTEGGVGLIWTVIPLTSAATNMLVGTIADYCKMHRAFFMAGMLILTITFTCVFFMPDVPAPATGMNATLSVQCSQDRYAKFVVCPKISDLHASEVAQSFPIFNQCDILENDSEKFVKQQLKLKYNLQCKMSKNNTRPPESALHFPTEFSLSVDEEQAYYNVCSRRNCNVITEVNVTNSFSEMYNIKCKDGEFSMYEYNCDTSIINHMHLTLPYLLHSVEYWTIFLNMMILYAGNGVTTTMADTVCFFLLGKNRHKYGHQRLWGSLAWGLFGMTSGGLVTYFSRGKASIDYTPVVALSIAFLTANLVVSFIIKFDVPKKEKLKASTVGKTLSSFKMIIFLITVLVGGITMGTQWTFFFIVVEDVAASYDPNFSYIKLIQGVLLGIDCFFGEVPFLFLSSYVIKRIGNVRTFCCVLIILTLRCFLYSCVTNPWYFLPINFLHGPSFGLMYPNMITYANALAPKGAQATIQGIVKSTFIGGVSLGGLIGGILMEKVGGSRTYLTIGLFDLIYTVIFIVVNFARRRHKKEKNKGVNEQEAIGDTFQGLQNEDKMPLNAKEPVPEVKIINESPQSQPADGFLLNAQAVE